MTISTWLMILALAAGTGTNQAIGGTSTVEPNGVLPRRIASHCWVNGVWYNPCPSEAPTGPPPDPGPEILTPV